MNKLPVLILAGKPDERDELLSYADVDNKVLITYKGRTLLQILIDAVKESSVASVIILVGLTPEEYPDGLEDEMIEFLPIQGEQFDKIYEGAKFIASRPELMGNGRHILYTSGDMPFMHAEVINSFLNNTMPREADFYYSVVPQKAALEGLPDVDWHYMKIKNDKMVSGNLILIDPETILDKYDLIKFLSQNRKRFIWGVLRTSPWLFLKLMLGQIRLFDVERLMTSYFGIESKLVVSSHYELAFDLDRIEQLDFIRKME